MGLKALEILRFNVSNEIGYKKEQLEAIEELEALQNRSCANCKHFNKDGAYYGVCKKDINTTKNQDEFLSNVEFYCNRWELK